MFLYGCHNENKVTVTLYLEGKQLGESIELSRGDKIIKPCADKEGYTIDGWYTSSDNGISFNGKWLFDNDIVEKDIALYAVWIPED